MISNWKNVSTGEEGSSPSATFGLRLSLPKPYLWTSLVQLCVLFCTWTHSGKLLLPLWQKNICEWFAIIYEKNWYWYFKDRDLGPSGSQEKAILCRKNSQVYHGLINQSTVIDGNHYGSMSWNKAELAWVMLSLWQRLCEASQDLLLSKSEGQVRQSTRRDTVFAQTFSSQYKLLSQFKCVSPCKLLKRQRVSCDFFAPTDNWTAKSPCRGQMLNKK